MPPLETPFPDQTPPAGLKPVSERLFPFAQTERLLPAFTTGVLLTVMVICDVAVHPFTVAVYVSVKFPAVKGAVQTPAELTNAGPLQVPPAGEAPLMVNPGSLAHTFRLLPAVTVGKEFTLMLVVDELLHPF